MLCPGLHSALGGVVYLILRELLVVRLGKPSGLWTCIVIEDMTVFVLMANLETLVSLALSRASDKHVGIRQTNRIISRAWPGMSGMN